MKIFYLLVTMLMFHFSRSQSQDWYEQISWYNKEFEYKLNQSKEKAYAKIISEKRVDTADTEIIVIINTYTANCEKLLSTHFRQNFLECTHVEYNNCQDVEISGNYILFKKGRPIYSFDPVFGIFEAPEINNDSIGYFSPGLIRMMKETDLIFQVKVLPIGLYFGIKDSSVVWYDTINENGYAELISPNPRWFETLEILMKD